MKNLAPLTPTSQKVLLQWFKENHRPLPWRKNRDPYRIWISEVMLQQTTSQAVIPFYERFMKRFPHLQDLARAQIDDVYEVWSGLGYYSRARNLLKCAQMIHQRKKFPQNYKELLELPGLGPYTARAISSLAFDEKVGVLDGNVIRVLSRLLNEPVEWWSVKGRGYLQDQVDRLVQKSPPYFMNQALMELGATICLPKNPKCLLCPVRDNCRGQKADTVNDLPLKKQKKRIETWIWEPLIIFKNGRWAFVEKGDLPVLKNQWLPPGKARLLSTPPAKFDFKHNITHHEIYVRPLRKRVLPPHLSIEELHWLSKEEIKRRSPTSLVQKVFQTATELP